MAKIPCDNECDDEERPELYDLGMWIFKDGKNKQIYFGGICEEGSEKCEGYGQTPNAFKWKETDPSIGHFCKDSVDGPLCICIKPDFWNVETNVLVGCDINETPDLVVKFEVPADKTKEFLLQGSVNGGPVAKVRLGNTGVYKLDIDR